MGHKLMVLYPAKQQRQTLKWTLRALQQDKLVPEIAKSLHSSSVVDLFCCLNDVCALPSSFPHFTFLNLF